MDNLKNINVLIMFLILMGLAAVVLFGFAHHAGDITCSLPFDCSFNVLDLASALHHASAIEGFTYAILASSIALAVISFLFSFLEPIRVLNSEINKNGPVAVSDSVLETEAYILRLFAVKASLNSPPYLS